MCGATRRAKQPTSQQEYQRALEEARQICEEMGWSPDDKALYEKALVSVLKGVLRGMTITHHERYERVKEIIRRID